jgi:hypothetical protein
VAVFWFTTLYGDAVIRWGGPIIVVIGLIVGMYSRRFSPLSSTGWTGEKGQTGHRRGTSEHDAGTAHHKSLDEIVEVLKLFTSRCNILLDPLLRLTDFLSTQRTATSATTRPALTALFIRILLITPVWILLTLPPLYVITTKRAVLFFGTVVLTWHSRPARVSRTILWRSRSIRRLCTILTGLQFHTPETESNLKQKRPPLTSQSKSPNDVAASLAAKRRPASPGIRFTFTLFENQRRWLGIGWTSSMLAYERAAWTDEHLNTAPSKDKFELPEVEGGHARWRWVKGSEWRVDGADKDGDESQGWIYYDNKVCLPLTILPNLQGMLTLNQWRDGRRGVDGWGRYTRRRKWLRDAELVEVTPSTEITPSPTPHLRPSVHNSETGSTDFAEDGTPLAPESNHQSHGAMPLTERYPADDGTDTSTNGKVRKRKWFQKSGGGSKSPSTKSGAASASQVSVSGSGDTGSSRRDEEEDVHSPLTYREDRDQAFGLSDDARMDFG